ncbi:hypothetical protein ABIA06_002988 [Bradyrhizobium yuanmingense]
MKVGSAAGGTEGGGADRRAVSGGRLDEAALSLASSLPDNPYDGHTLRDVIERTESLTGCAIERAYVDKGYRGHDTQNPRRVFISGQKHGVFGVIKRELRRRLRAHHRTHEERRSPWPLLSQRPRRRCR